MYLDRDTKYKIYINITISLLLAILIINYPIQCLPLPVLIGNVKCCHNPFILYNLQVYFLLMEINFLLLKINFQLTENQFPTY